MEREESPDWLRDFKSPTVDAVMVLSSSPSSSPKGTPDTDSAKGSPEGSIDKAAIPEDSSLLVALGGMGAMPKDVTPKKRGRPPGSKNKNVKEKNASPAAEGANLEDDPEQGGKKVVSSRRPKGGKKIVNCDGEDQQLNPPAKVRKTTAAKVVKEGAEPPKSTRKNKRVSLPEDQEAAPLKRVKRELELESVKATVGEDEENDDETAPISKLSAARKTPEQSLPEPDSAAAAATLPKSSSGPSTSALTALVGDHMVIDDCLDLSQVGLSQDLLAAEETGELSERKPKKISSSLPVIFAEKIHRTKVLLECEDDSLDLSGDMGAVGRFTVTGEGDGELSLDLKGVIYRTTIVPSNTFFVVRMVLRKMAKTASSFLQVNSQTPSVDQPKYSLRIFLQVNVGQTEAKVEAIMNDFIQLQPDVNQVGDETVVEGTLEDFGFEVDNVLVDGAAVPNGTATPAAEGEGEHEDNEDKPKKKAPTKTQGKKAGAGSAGKVKPKASGKGTAKKPRAKGKAASKKPSKAKAARKPKAAKG
ncbi:hypothetical protein R1sor_006709 [Riccia sorocarpa]|uniref:Uncharacterized protein n=1 Tax=Riccia sorocarpa TaxID=122646 RepID=A0ABD3HNU2_9MARC